MKRFQLLTGISKGQSGEYPFFIIVTVIMVGISAVSIGSTPSLRQPVRLVPFIILMLIHILLYWTLELWSKKLPWTLFFLALQGAIAFGAGLFVQNVALVFGMYMGLIGLTVGLLKFSRWGISLMGLYLVLSLATYLRQTGGFGWVWWLVTIPMTAFVVVYVTLYNRQVVARARAQALLAELETANRKLASYAVEIETLTLTNERQRMARELHDTLSQGLAGLILQLEAANAHLANEHPQRAREIVQQAMEQARATLADARRAIGDLRQAPAGTLDLNDAVEQETAHFTDATGIPCQIDSYPPGALPQSLVEPARRVLAEALTNIARHARASQVSLRLACTPGWLEMTITDDGAGFDPQAAADQAGHYGLLGMSERARLAGGTLDVTSQPGKGTTLRLRLPVNVAEPASESQRDSQESA